MCFLSRRYYRTLSLFWWESRRNFNYFTTKFKIWSSL